ncbi:MAG: glycosyltransferase N-terminal domain-containing protein [Arhodomonas sp.]|nr:glycosyltransferase N-terminal domain-containing protein [Arhodomonas sp.]
MAGVLACPDAIAAQNREDAERLMHLGAPAARVFVTGSLKFDFTVSATARAQGRELPATLGNERPRLDRCQHAGWRRGARAGRLRRSPSPPSRPPAAAGSTPPGAFPARDQPVPGAGLCDGDPQWRRGPPGRRSFSETPWAS